MSSSVLGKRKERKQEDTVPAIQGSTLFVSNLPFTATSTDLRTLFSDIGPVRSAFVVLDRDSGVSKGVGYVSFAIKEDAKAAIEQFDSQGIVLDGRALRVQLAASKPKEKNLSKKEHKALAQPSYPKVSLNPLALQTIVISGLPCSIDSKSLWKKVRKLDGVEKLEWPAKSDDGEEDSNSAHVLFKTPSSAAEAVSRLHAHVFKGSLLSVTLKRRLDSLVKPKTATVESAAPSRASRLIVRNLPWDITEQDLRALFLPYGPIHSIHFPTSDGDNKTKRGFAFVWMLGKHDAQDAIAGCNGKSVRAGLASELLEDKQKKKKQKRVEKKLMLSQAVQNGEKEVDGVEDAKERVIAVDWALSKEKWNEAKAKLLEESDGSEHEGAKYDAGSDSEGESQISSSESGSGHDSEGDSEGDSEVNNESDVESDSGRDESVDEAPARPQLPPPESGTTVFIRNVPFEATDDELRTLFRAFGPLRYARITMDTETARSRGTGFACFWNKADADKVIEQSELLRTETMGHELHTKKNPFTVPSILTPDPSSTLASNLVLHGRTLGVVRAVTRDEAGKLKQDGEKKREKADKRNMHLLREGVISPGTPAAANCEPAELEKRTNSFNARRTMLRSNSALFVSRTRLSVRQIPLFVTERVLKRMAIHAARAFEDEVKEGTRVALTENEMTEAADDDENPEVEEEEGDKKTKQAKKKHVGRGTGVQQTKIVRQQERVDVVTGKGRSKGYGFVEMCKHADALRVLRWANNNRDLGSLFESWWKDELKDLLKAEKEKPENERDKARMKKINEELEGGGARKARGTLIVEFSIENSQVVRRRAAQQKDRDSVPKQKEPPPKQGSEGPPAKKRRTSSVQAAEKEEGPSVKVGSRIGSLIGRKRKLRKSGR